MRQIPFASHIAKHDSDQGLAEVKKIKALCRSKSVRKNLNPSFFQVQQVELTIEQDSIAIFVEIQPSAINGIQLKVNPSFVECNKSNQRFGRG